MRHIGNRGTVLRSAGFEINTADLYIAGPLPHAEQIIVRRRQNFLIVLCHHVLNDAYVGSVVEHDPLFAVVYVEIVRHHMFAQYETVSESLRRNVPQHVVVILVAGSDQPRGMTRIRLQLFAGSVIADISIR